MHTVSAGPRCRHTVQFYGADREMLVSNVAAQFAASLAAGDGAVAIATAEHSPLFAAALNARGRDVEADTAGGRLVLLDAQRTLDSFCSGGRIDPDAFERVVGDALASCAAAGRGAVHAYGEMVGLLWTHGETRAAVALERLWNDFLARHADVTLACGYPIDVFGGGFGMASIDGVLCEHGECISGGAAARMDAALEHALSEGLGERAGAIRPLMRPNFRPAWAALPQAESVILWIRNNLGDRAEAILSLAREYYRTCSSP